MDLCHVCGTQADQRCKRCKNVFYCGKECQQEDWGRGGHRDACLSPTSSKSAPIGMRTKGGQELTPEELAAQLQAAAERLGRTYEEMARAWQLAGAGVLEGEIFSLLPRNLMFWAIKDLDRRSIQAMCNTNVRFMRFCDGRDGGMPLWDKITGYRYSHILGPNMEIVGALRQDPLTRLRAHAIASWMLDDETTDDQYLVLELRDDAYDDRRGYFAQHGMPMWGQPGLDIRVNRTAYLALRKARDGDVFVHAADTHGYGPYWVERPDMELPAHRVNDMAQYLSMLADDTAAEVDEEFWSKPTDDEGDEIEPDDDWRGFGWDGQMLTYEDVTVEWETGPGFTWNPRKDLARSRSRAALIDAIGQMLVDGFEVQVPEVRGTSIAKVREQMTIATSISSDASAMVVEAVCPPVDPSRGLINYADIKFGKELGRGAFGIVAAGTYRGQPVAIKTVQGQPTPAAIEEFTKESQLLANLPAHPNVVRFIGITQNPLVLVTELVTGGGLDSRLKPGKPDVLWSDVMKWARDIARGIGHLHANGILHRDMATRNVLLDDKDNAKVTDFGLSRRICTQDPELRFRQQEFFRGPYKWMPPESLANQDFSVKSDTWAYGVTLWEIMSRRTPFEFLDIETVKKWVIGNQMRLPLPQRWPQRLRDLLMSCWDTNPAKRPTMPTISGILRAIGDSAYNGRPLPAISEQEIRQLYGIR